MSEKTNLDKEFNKKVKTLYRMALVCYILPFICLGFYYLSLSEIFWKMFLLGMFPFGLLGLLFSIMGIINASRQNNYQKRTRGYYSLLMGILTIAGGILGWILLYIVAN